MKSLLVLVSCLWIGATTVGTQSVDWARYESTTRPAWRDGFAVAHDPVRNRTVLFGGIWYGNRHVAFDDTWEWDGTTWRRANPVHRPPARHGHAMVWDGARQRIVLFGGRDAGSGFFGDAWSWDGVDWTPISMVGGPTPRHRVAMAFDSRRGRVIVHGGWNNAKVLDELWEWDGTRWFNVRSTVQPIGRRDHAMVFDPVRGRAVLFGGGGSNSMPLNDTWEWDGATWTQRSPRTSPPVRQGHRMAFDATTNRVVLFGAMQTNMSPRLTDTWAWDGNDWSQQTVTQAPPPDAAGMVYDPAGQRVLLFTGVAHRLFADEVWAFRLGNWQPVTLAGNPLRRFGASFTYDSTRRRIVMFGGSSTATASVLNDLWEWDGDDGWVERRPTTSPPPRYVHAMVEDPARGRIVLFGGIGATGALADTWEWDGTNWTQAAVTTGPSPRGLYSMSYDPVRGRTVLFGGGDWTQVFGDTWEWDGARWTPLSVTTSPSAREGGAMAFDPVRGETILFGGLPGARCAVPPVADMWSWNGRTWRALAPASSPAPRHAASITYDATRQRMILVGGEVPAPLFPRCFASVFQDAWTWNGAGWTQVSSVPSSIWSWTGRSPCFVHDVDRGRTVLLDSSTGMIHHRRATDLVPSTHAVSVATGGVVSLRLRAGPEHGGRAFALLGCVDLGAMRGIPLGGGITLPLSPGPYFSLTASTPAVVFTNGRGVLSKDGKATATIRVPAGLPPTAIGTRFYHAYVVYGSRVLHASAAVPLRLVP